MYITTTTKCGREYASAARSVREGKRTRVEHTYLGRVVDAERGIFFNKERKYFTFDVATGAYGKVPEDFSEEGAPEDGRRAKRRQRTFGDAFLIDQILWKSGFWEVVDAIPWANKDTLHAMVTYYICSTDANCHAESWYGASVASMLFPRARLDSQGISDMLEKIGSAESVLAFQEAYVEFVYEHYSDDTNVMIDSTGLPNKSGMYLTRLNVHDGKANVEARMAIVAQRSTAIQLYWRLMPGTASDAMSFKRLIAHAAGVGVRVDSCLIDAGYCTNVNLDDFYDEDHNCVVDYITRPKSSLKWCKEAVSAALEGLEDGDNFFRFDDRFFYVRRVEVMVGQRRDQPAYLYVGIDKNRLSDELRKLLRRAKKKKLSIEKVHEEMERQGVFTLVSGRPYEPDQILPEYYVRQGIEQLNDVAKNYTKLLPARCHKQETFSGHVLLSMIANAVVRFIQIQLNDSEAYLGSRMHNLHDQCCILYKTKLVPDDPIKEANDVYRAFKIEVPTSIPIRDGKLMVTRPKRVPHLFRVPKTRQGRTERLVAAATPEPDAEGASEDVDDTSE